MGLIIISRPIDAKGLASDCLEGGGQDQGQHAAFLPPEPASSPDPAHVLMTPRGGTAHVARSHGAFEKASSVCQGLEPVRWKQSTLQI